MTSLELQRAFVYVCHMLQPSIVSTLPYISRMVLLSRSFLTTRREGAWASSRRRVTSQRASWWFSTPDHRTQAPTRARPASEKPCPSMFTCSEVSLSKSGTCLRMYRIFSSIDRPKAKGFCTGFGNLQLFFIAIIQNQSKSSSSF